MILATAQTVPSDGNIQANLSDHYRLINLAADHGAELIVFPELSITGYQRENAYHLHFTEHDPRLEGLRKLAADRAIIIIAGAPILLSAHLYIGAFVIYPDGSEFIYTKRYLHDGEELFFIPGLDTDLNISVKDQKLSLAICADITNPLHPQKAFASGTDLYVASIFYTPNGIKEAFTDLASYASEYSMFVLMSNYGGASYGFEAAGGSAFWNKYGELVGAAEGTSEGLGLVKKVDGQFQFVFLPTF